MSKGVYKAVELWRKKCLVEDGSIFSKDEQLWTADLLGELRGRYEPVVVRVDPVAKDFIVELEHQLLASSSDYSKLMAEILWFLYLYASDIKITTKRDRVREVWSWSATGNSIPDNHSMLSDSVLEGISRAGHSFGRFKFRFECADFMEVICAFKKNSKSKRKIIMSDNIDFDIWLDNHIERNRHIRHILRHLLFPDFYGPNITRNQSIPI